MALYFAVTLFVSAFLLFLVQPMVGKMVLPLVGGSPSVWSACMVFFQALLLAGYSYAHAAVHGLGVRRQSVFHTVILLLPLAAMGICAALSGGSPIHAFTSLAPAGGVFPFFGVLVLLAAAVGLPFFVCATSAPLLQRWFADTNHPDARDPYFLYSASNLGSLIALVAYPALIEPNLRLSAQAWVWAAGYAGLVALTIGCAARLRSSPPPAPASIPKRPDAPPQTERTRTGPGGKQSARGPSPAAKPRLTDVPPTWGDRLRWLGLSAVPTSLLLSVTSFLTTDITPMPMLWLVPLGLYLITFIIAFGRTPNWVRKAIELAAPVGVLILLWTLISDNKPSSWVGAMSLHLVMFLLIALNCHMELNRRRPPAAWLTEFFLWMSLGGVLGGLFNALVAPLVFIELTEYPLALIAACLLQAPGDPDESGAGGWFMNLFFNSDSDGKDRGSNRAIGLALDLVIPVVVGGLTWALLSFVSMKSLPQPTAKFPVPGYGPWDVLPKTLWGYLVYGLPMLVAYFWVERPLRFGLAVGAIWLAGSYYTQQRDYELHDGERVMHRYRSFFGRLSVDEQVEEDPPNPTIIYHKLVHGTTLHGKQQFNPLSTDPLTYYHRTGPIGQVFAEKLPAVVTGNLAFVGLGSGTMAAYVEPGQKGTFYEIDKTVQMIAEDPKYFTFLHDCKGKYEIVLGDARLKMDEHGQDGEYAVIVVDAFSSDAIPVHLLTKEAVELYRRRLKPGGIIALHISNRYLDLTPVAAKIAKELGMVGLHQWDSDAGFPGKNSSEWIMLANKIEDFGGLPQRTYEGLDDNGNAKQLLRWDELVAGPDAPLWTDDFSNFLQIMEWKRILKIGD